MPLFTILSEDSPAISPPWKMMFPARGVSIPDNVLITVVFPEPFPPSKETILFSGTVKETSRSTSVTPYHTLR